MAQNTASDTQTAPATDPFGETVYGMDRAEWNRYGETGRECPEWCFHGGTCAHARAELHAFEAQAEGAWLRAAEGGLDDELEQEAALRLYSGSDMVTVDAGRLVHDPFERIAGQPA